MSTQERAEPELEEEIQTRLEKREEPEDKSLDDVTGGARNNGDPGSKTSQVVKTCW